MANATPEFAYATSQREAFCAELDMALNFMKFATVASDPELAQYVHGKARESYQRLSKLSAQSRSEDMPGGALHALQRRLDEFQGRMPAATKGQRSPS